MLEYLFSVVTHPWIIQRAAQRISFVTLQFFSRTKRGTRSLRGINFQQGILDRTILRVFVCSRKKERKRKKKYSIQLRWKDFLFPCLLLERRESADPWIANRLKPFNVYTTRTMLTKRARNADKKRARNGRTPTRAKVGRRTVASAEARSGWRGAWRAGDEAPPTNSAVKCDAVGVLPRRQSGRVSLREAAWWGRGGVSGVWVSFERSVPGDATLVARFSFTLPVFHCSRFPAACAYTTVSLPVRGRKTRRSSRLGIVTATPPRAIFEQGIGRRESDGERWMDFRIPPEGVRFGRWRRRVSTVFSDRSLRIRWNGRFLDFRSRVLRKDYPFLPSFVVIRKW